MLSRRLTGLWGWGLGCALAWVPVSAVEAQTCTDTTMDVERIPDADLVGLPDLPGNKVSEGCRLITRNFRAASVLSRLDIDGDERPDNSPDTDGDGLPDNWEVGGAEALTEDGVLLDRVVYFPAPSAIVPGTPPTPIFSRLAVATSALNPDTDGDGLSDFTEVFGLRFIDEYPNDGLLEATEWFDENNDGLPSPGEGPRSNVNEIPNLLHDFDGFVFTDPTNRDTDGDGFNDREDNDPLINPRAFGIAGPSFVRGNLEGDKDLDNDGLGNGMDLGNDLVEVDGVTRDYQEVDNPESIRFLLEQFREDLLAEGVIPESQIEDLLAADWDANGLWRTTDVREWSIVIDTNGPAQPPAEYFDVDGHHLYFPQTFEELANLYNDPDYQHYGGRNPAGPGARAIGLGWQNLLKPSGRTAFLPDFRVWAILYAWRVPGFDIDGDGFVGVPNISSTVSGPDDPGIASVALHGEDRNGDDVIDLEEVDTLRLVNTTDLNTSGPEELPFDDRIEVTERSGTGAGQGNDNAPDLDGRIDAPKGFPALPCGAIGTAALVGTLLGVVVLRLRRC